MILRPADLEIWDGEFSLVFGDVTAPSSSSPSQGWIGAHRTRFSAQTTNEGWFGDTAVTIPPSEFHLRVITTEAEHNTVAGLIIPNLASKLQQEVDAVWFFDQNPQVPAGTFQAVWGVWVGETPNTSLPTDLTWIRSTSGGTTVHHLFGPDWRSQTHLHFKRIDDGMDDAARATLVSQRVAALAGTKVTYVQETWL